MSATHTPTEHNQPDILRCTRCNAVLPQYATFCGQCGERVKQPKQEPSSLHYGNIAERYRVTSLVRRRTYTQLFFAFDNQQRQYVAINAINLHTLEEAERTKAIEAFQQHYDMLRRQSVPTLMHLIDLRYSQEHLYVIGNWPRRDTNPQARHRPLSTLFTLLQSGIGLPDEQVAIAWVYRLSRTLELLHKNKIVPGDIDPDSILVNETNFESDPALMASWQPELLPHPSINTNTAYFYAPETLIGDIEPRSDIYSLGAILYLLLSGVTPKDATERIRQPLASLREINPHINNTIDAVVMRALALEKTERYQNASEFSEALLQLSANPDDLRQAQKFPAQPTQPVKPAQPAQPVKPAQTVLPARTQQDQEEIHISSQVADNTIDKTATKQPAAEEVTISIVPLQAQMARRYLSKIKTGKIETQGKPSGEEPVEEGLTKEKASGEDVVADSTPQAQTDKTITENLPSHKSTVEETMSEEQLMKLVAARLAAKAPDEREQIQNQKTIGLSPLVKETDEADDKAREIEEQDTISFTYEVDSAEDIHEEIHDQKEKGLEEGANKRAIQRQAVINVPDQAPISERLKALLLKTASSLPGITRPREIEAASKAISKQLVTYKDSLLLKQIQHFLLGEPHNSTKAAALIETPLRIQPNQNYSIRINVIGRNKPKGAHQAGLSAMAQGEKVHIEVRSALYQNYAYIVQQADIQLPGEGYVAEITMPMQPLGGGPSGRRERLHIFFMDDANSPLYEKPFAIELFISPLVQSGREGHNVLSIPL